MLNIRMSFEQDFSDLYNSFTNSDKGKEFLRLTGIQRQNLDLPEMVNQFFNNHIGDMSVNGNANVGNNKSPTTFSNEIVSPAYKLVGIYMLWQQLVEDHGLDTANDLIKKYIIGTVYIHDSTRLLVPYCFSASTSNILFEGRPYSPLQSKPPKRLQSFVGACTEYAMDLSLSFCGAVAFGDFLVNIAWFAEKDKLSDSVIQNCIQSFTHVMQNPFRIGGDSPFTNISVFDEPNLNKLFENYQYPDGNSPLKEPWLSSVKKVQEIFLKFIAAKDPITKMPYRFPVTTLNLFVEDGKVKDEEFLDLVTTHNREGLFNIFVTDDIAKIASCCRLTSSITDLMKFRSVDSFGNAGINIGSSRIVTLNFYRLCRRFKGKNDEFDTYLKNYLDAACKVLSSHRKILKRLIDSNFLKFFKLGWINLDKMFFSTIGLTGMWEGFKELGIDILEEEGLKQACGIFSQINAIVETLSEKYQMPVNLEQIPGETAAITLAKKDKLFFNDEEQAYKLYANQFIPLWEDVDLYRRAEVDGTLDKYFNGGVISHLNISSKPTKKAMKKLIEFAVEKGLSHFALNPIYSKCAKCDTTSFGKIDSCPKCESKEINYLTRIVGYFTPVSSWVNERRNWEFNQRKWKELGKE